MTSVGPSRRRPVGCGGDRAGCLNQTAADRHDVPLRQLLKADPDVYLTTSDSGTTLATLRHDHLTKRLQAVRKGRFGILQAKLAEPGPQIGEALVQVAKILHPEAFR